MAAKKKAADSGRASALGKLRRSVLDELAAERGLDPLAYRNKTEIVAALLETDAMPDGLTSYGAAAWHRVLAKLQGRPDGLEPTDMPAVERYVRSLEVARACWDQIDFTDLTRTGSMGQPVTDPLVDSALKAEKHAQVFAKSLGIEPEARQTKSAGGRPSETFIPAGKPRAPEPPAVSPLRAVK